MMAAKDRTNIQHPRIDPYAKLSTPELKALLDFKGTPKATHAFTICHLANAEEELEKREGKYATGNKFRDMEDHIPTAEIPATNYQALLRRRDFNRVCNAESGGRNLGPRPY